MAFKTTPKKCNGWRVPCSARDGRFSRRPFRQAVGRWVMKFSRSNFPISSRQMCRMIRGAISLALVWAESFAATICNGSVASRVWTTLLRFPRRSMAPGGRNTCPAELLRWPGVAQLRPGSAFLRNLNRDAQVLDRVRFTTIWTPLDLMVLPAASSRMPVGAETKLWVPFHPLMVWLQSCHRAVAVALSN